MKRNLLISTILGAVSISSLSLTACSEPKQPSGFIDKSGGMVLNLDKLSPRPTVLGNFSEGLAVVKTEKGWGCLSKTGELVFDQPFKYLSPFAEGVAAYCTTDGASRERWGYIYKNGTTAVRPAFAAAQKFSGDLAAVKLPDEHEDPKKAGRWCYIDKGGQQVIQDTFEAAEPFHDGLAVVKVNGKMGAINTAGNLIVPAKYDVVYSASNGNIVAARGTGLSGENPDQVLDYMDAKGKVQFQKTIHGVTLKNLRPKLWVKFDPKETAEAAVESGWHRPLSSFVSPGFSENKSIGQVDAKFAINQQFDARAFAGFYDYIYPVTGGYFVAYEDANGGKMDYRGGVPEEAAGIWNSKTFRFFDAAPFSDGLGLVQESKDGRYGFVDKSAQFALKPTYKYARSFRDSLALVGDAPIQTPEEYRQAELVKFSNGASKGPDESTLTESLSGLR